MKDRKYSITKVITFLLKLNINSWNPQSPSKKRERIGYYLYHLCTNPSSHNHQTKTYCSSIINSFIKIRCHHSRNKTSHKTTLLLILLQYCHRHSKKGSVRCLQRKRAKKGPIISYKRSWA
jgi:hypothetical protein